MKSASEKAERRNKGWQRSWGAYFDPKSCPIVEVSKEELRERQEASTSIPIGDGSTDIMKSAFHDFWEIRRAIQKGEKAIDSLIAQPDPSFKKEVKVVKTSVNDNLPLDDPFYEDGETVVNKCRCGYEKVNAADGKMVCVNAECAY
jgi:hypothetical protein